MSAHASVRSTALVPRTTPRAHGQYCSVPGTVPGTGTGNADKNKVQLGARVTCQASNIIGGLRSVTIVGQGKDVNALITGRPEMASVTWIAPTDDLPRERGPLARNACLTVPRVSPSRSRRGCEPPIPTFCVKETTPKCQQHGDSCSNPTQLRTEESRINTSCPGSVMVGVLHPNIAGPVGPVLQHMPFP